MSINQLTHQWAQFQNHFSLYLPEITSTNDWAKENFPDENKNFALYLTDHQTKGRGRNENLWKDLGRGDTLLSTWCFRFKQTPQPIITPLIGLCVYDALKIIDPALTLRLKAPNDIYLNEKKLSGLLIEVVQQGENNYLFIGLGMNIYGAPHVDQPTAFLADNDSVSDEKWFQFCTAFLTSLEKTFSQSLTTDLNSIDQKRLLEALNVGLTENKKFTSISSKGDLYTKDQMIPWFSL